MSGLLGGAGWAGRAPGLTCGWPGADVVDWLYTHVEGFKERREARKYASSMLKHGFLRHTVNKVTFSEQCYYVFGDLCSSEWGCGVGRPRGPGPPALALTRPPSPGLAALTLHSGSSGASDQDMLAPLPHPAAPWPLGQGYPYQYPGPPPCFPPAYQDPGFSYGSGSAGSQQSEGERLPGASPLPSLPPGSARALPPALCTAPCSVLGPWAGSLWKGRVAEGSGEREPKELTAGEAEAGGREVGWESMLW